MLRLTTGTSSNHSTHNLGEIAQTLAGKVKLSNLSQPGVNFINIIRMHFSYEILVPKTTKLTFGFEILEPKILYEKRSRIMMMTLTPVVNFTSIFQPQSSKAPKDNVLTVFLVFALLGYVCVKAVPKHVG
jgi:hypothetical protein